ncbi:MAG TPA: PEP-CTERM sorting domain-containing protein [Phycisphaerae bacterium]|jgi:hypothetical protein|nr:PEP-CTERM sorting domain-containing protein [Phycisphaerae bacterium]
MKMFLSAAAGLAALALSCGAAQAREFDFLQIDPRFTGGEFNINDPAHPNFWFYDQYQPARMTFQIAGVNMVPVTHLTMPELVADSDMLYMPIPTNPTASTYPLTNGEIDVLRQYVQNSQYTGGRSIIFNLTGASAAMTNDLLGKLGLSGHMANGTITGPTSYPIPDHPVIKGMYGNVGSFTENNVGYFDSLGSMRSLVNVNGYSVLPYVEKGDLGSTWGSYFFLLDDKILMNWNSQDPNYQVLFQNLGEYAMQDQFKHYTVPANLTPPVVPTGPRALAPAVMIPEPASVGVLGLGVLALLARRKK